MTPHQMKRNYPSGPERVLMNDPVYPDERREDAVQTTLNQYLWDLYGTDEENSLGERGVLG